VRPPLETDEAFGRRVRHILDASHVGLRFEDNVGDVVELRYLNAEAPYTLAVSLREPPAAVTVGRALNVDAGGYESGCRVRWTWRDGRVRIDDIDVSSTGDAYAVELWIWRA
jgi:hypothetical protein